MNEGLYWLALTALATGSFWVVYVLNRFAVVGIFESLNNPRNEWPPLADWAIRAKSAHTNAIENLIIFGTLVLAAYLVPNQELHQTTTLMAQLFFFSRIAHFVSYTIGIPVVRTIAFLGGFFAQVMVALAIIGQLG